MIARRSSSSLQLELFGVVVNAFSKSPDGVQTKQLYADVEKATGRTLSHRCAIGRAGVLRSPGQRQVRWIQQTLKKLGLVEPVAHQRGSWRLTSVGKQKLTPAPPRSVMIACSTDLGLALWSSHQDIFAYIDEPITLSLCSPPYPLAKQRAYGGPTRGQYIDFICSALEPIVRNLRSGGSILLNLSNAIFEHKSPSRSMYREHLVIALHERLGLHKMDDLVWENPCKPPGPTYWSSLHRYHLTATWESVLWMTNSPLEIIADNRRVLQPHTAAHRKLMNRGGEGRVASYGDGAYTLRSHSFGRQTDGRIPRNILRYAHNCPDKSGLSRFALAENLPVHGATMPLALADFLVRYLSAPEDLVVDAFGGWLTTAKAAEQNGRRWLVTELMGEYVRVGIERLRYAPGFVAGSLFT